MHTHHSQTRARGSLEGDSISGKVFASIIGTTYPSTFEHRRRQNEYVFDPLNGTLTPFADAFPAWVISVLPATDVAESAERDRELEKSFRKRSFLCVPIWGGWQEPGGRYWYSKRQAEAIRDRGVIAVFEVWQAIRSKGITVAADAVPALMGSGNDGSDSLAIGDSAGTRGRRPTRRSKKKCAETTETHEL
jgi:hypothetical protein